MSVSRATELCAALRRRLGLAAVARTVPVARLAREAGTSRKFIGAQRDKAARALDQALAEPAEVECGAQTFPRVSRVADKALGDFKTRVRQLTGRSGGCSMEQVVEKLRPYLLGWRAYFGLAQTPQVWRRLDKWLRHRLRAIQLKHWKRPRTIYRELKALGADDDVARRVAMYGRRWWRNSAMLLNGVLSVAHFDRLGVPRLS